jgi:hypothetical protein
MSEATLKELEEKVRSFLPEELKEAYIDTGFLDEKGDNLLIVLEDSGKGFEISCSGTLHMQRKSATGSIGLGGTFSRPFLARRLVRGWEELCRNEGIEFLYGEANIKPRLWQVMGYSPLTREEVPQWEHYLPGQLAGHDPDDEWSELPVYKLL